MTTVSAATSLEPAASDVLVVELWRVVGLATWAALLAGLVAPSPVARRVAVALMSELTLVVVGLLIAPAAPGAGDLVLWDGILTVVLAVGAVAAARTRTVQQAR